MVVVTVRQITILQPSNIESASERNNRLEEIGQVSKRVTLLSSLRNIKSMSAHELDMIAGFNYSDRNICQEL